MVEPPSESDRNGDQTSVHVMRARNGDQQSLGWVVARFSPLLLAQATFRLSRGLSGFYEPDDLVSDVWSVALPHLATTDAPESGGANALLRFLSTTLVYRVNNLMRKHFRGERLVREGDVVESAPDLFGRPPVDATGVVTKLIERERDRDVLGALGGLEALDREIVIMRGIEQTSNETVGSVLGMKPNTVSHRYRRALEKLRERLPGSVFSEIDDGGD